jgi:hypothetical protein
MIACDYECAHHGRFEIFEEREAAIERDCPECGQASPFCYPGPSIKQNYASATTGKADELPAGFVSTSEIADGRMSVREYKAARAAKRREQLRAAVRAKIL